RRGDPRRRAQVPVAAICRLARLGRARRPCREDRNPTPGHEGLAADPNMTTDGDIETNPVAAANDFVIARVRDEFTRWCEEMPSGIDEQRVQAVRAVLAAAFEANPQAAARTWTFFRHVLSQRAGFDAELLRRADACATDGYLAFGVKGL